MGSGRVPFPLAKEDGRHLSRYILVLGEVRPLRKSGWRGFALYLAGFHHVKDWYLAEGGMEGPRKLWGEKAPDADWERTFREWTRRQLLPFLEREVPADARDLVEAARGRAEDALRLIREGK